jgi:hypothetical protein
MMPNPDAMTGLQSLQALAEQYMESQPQCFLCQDAPGIMPLVFLDDSRDGDRVRGCCFAVCAVCWCSEDFQARVSEALRMARAQRHGVWN